MDKLDRDEKLWGGIFGIIAILAAIAEMFINGVDAASVASAIKDISGTLVVVVLLVAFLRNLPRRPKDIADLLEKKVEQWGDDNIPLIFKTENYQSAQGSNYTQGFVLLQDPKSYIPLAAQKGSNEDQNWHKFAQYGNNKLTGKFLDMPNYVTMVQSDFNVLFVMEQSHFKSKPSIDFVIGEIISAVNLHCSGRMSADRVGASLKFRLSCKKIETDQDVAAFVDALDFVLSLVKVVA